MLLPEDKYNKRLGTVPYKSANIIWNALFSTSYHAAQMWHFTYYDIEAEWGQYCSLYDSMLITHSCIFGDFYYFDSCYWMTLIIIVANNLNAICIMHLLLIRSCILWDLNVIYTHALQCSLSYHK